MFSTVYEVDRRLIVATRWAVRQVEKFLKIRWVTMVRILQSLNLLFLFIQFGLGLIEFFINEKIAIGFSLFVLAFAQSEVRESLDEVIEHRLGPLVIQKHIRARRLWRVLIGYTLVGALIAVLFSVKISFLHAFGVVSLCLMLATLYFESTTPINRNFISQ